MKRIFVCLFLLCLISGYAQDSHYWNLQYGTRSTLLGGAVIGSVTDLSGTYYNPGAVSLYQDPKLILSAKVYQYEKITVINGAGENKDLDYSNITPSPTFIAFNIDIDKSGRNKLAFSVLTRHSMNFDLKTRQIDMETNIVELNNDIRAGGLTLEQKYDDIWGGLTFSHKLNDIIGVGTTAYLVFHNQTTNFNIVIEGLDTSSQISSVLAFRDLKYNNFSLLLKSGLAANLDPVTMGITITTPNLNIAGSGSFGYHNFVNIPTDQSQNVFESNYQDQLKTRHNTSWVIGAGIAYWWKSLSLHFSAEWYNAVKNYELVKLDPLYSQGTGTYFNQKITQQLKSIINFGIGADFKLTDKFSLAGSFITDFSANDPNNSSGASLSNGDIYHISAGSYFNVGGSEITFGLSYSFANDVIDQIADIGNIDPNKVKRIGSSAQVKFTRIKVLFGFIF